MKIRLCSCDWQIIAFISTMVFLFWFQGLFVYQVIPRDNVVKNSTMDECNSLKLMECRSLSLGYYTWATEPKECCTYEEGEYVIKETYSYRITGDVKKYFKDLEKARKCQDVQHLI